VVKVVELYDHHPFELNANLWQGSTKFKVALKSSAEILRFVFCQSLQNPLYSRLCLKTNYRTIIVLVEIYGCEIRPVTVNCVGDEGSEDDIKEVIW